MYIFVLLLVMLYCRATVMALSKSARKAKKEGAKLPPATTEKKPVEAHGQAHGQGGFFGNLLWGGIHASPEKENAPAEAPAKSYKTPKKAAPTKTSPRRTRSKAAHDGA